MYCRSASSESKDWPSRSRIKGRLAWQRRAIEASARRTVSSNRQISQVTHYHHGGHVALARASCFAGQLARKKHSRRCAWLPWRTHLSTCSIVDLILQGCLQKIWNRYMISITRNNPGNSRLGLRRAERLSTFWLRRSTFLVSDAYVMLNGVGFPIYMQLHAGSIQKAMTSVH